MSRSSARRLEDILLACDAIDEHLRRGPAGDPLADGLVFDAVRVRLIEIGEAAKDLPADLTAAEPDLPWREIAGMRNQLAHRYFDTSHAILTATVRTTCPSYAPPSNDCSPAPINGELMIDPVVDQASRERIHATPSPATVPGSLPVLFFGDILSEHNEPAGVLHGLPPPLAIPAGQALAGSLGFGIVGTEDDFVDVQDANAGPPTRPGLTFASEGGAAGSDGRRRPGSYRWCDTHRDTHHAVVLDDGDGCWVMHPFGTEPACTEPGTVQWSAEGRCSGDRR